MDKQDLERIQNELQDLRRDLHIIAHQYGLRSQETMKASQLLDDKINEYNRILKQVVSR